jgi:hypothetical protein
VAAANDFLRTGYIAEFNRRFQVQATERGSAFVPATGKDLERIFSLQFQRRVNQDNTVSIQNLILQIQAVRWRATLAGSTVTVHQHLDETFSITHGPHRLGHYSKEGALQRAHQPAQSQAEEKPRRGKVKNATFPPPLEIPQPRGIPTFPQLRRLLVVRPKPDTSRATKTGHLNLLTTAGRENR